MGVVQIDGTAEGRLGPCVVSQAVPGRAQGQLQRHALCKMGGQGLDPLHCQAGLIVPDGHDSRSERNVTIRRVVQRSLAQRGGGLVRPSCQEVVLGPIQPLARGVGEVAAQVLAHTALERTTLRRCRWQSNRRAQGSRAGRGSKR